MPINLSLCAVAWCHRVARITRLAVLVMCCLIAAQIVAGAEEGDANASLLTLSEPYRVALHHDPSLSAPLKRLWDIYAGRNSSADLLQLYRGHVGNYPQDARAWAVLVRLLEHAGESPAADEALATALRANPQDAYLRRLQAGALANEGRTSEAAAAYIQAATETQQAGKRRLWLREGMLLAARADAQQLLERGFEQWQTGDRQAVDATLDLARELLRAGQSAHAQRLVADLGELQGETLVEATLLRAEVAALRGEHLQATTVLDELLDRLDSSYWRRQEIFGRRLRLVGADHDEQDRFVARLRERSAEQPQNASVWLDLHRALTAFARSDEALQALQQAVEHLADDPDLERALVRSYQREGRLQDLADWLEQRLQSEPQRPDLRARLVLTLHILEQPAAAEAAFDQLLQQLPPSSHHQQRIGLARQLAPLGLSEAATQLVLRVLDDEPARLDLLSEALSWTHEHAPLRVGDLLVPQRLSQPDAEVAVAIDLARNLIAINQRAAAWQVLSAVLESYPSHSDLRALLAETAWYLGDLRGSEEHRQKLLELSETPAAYRRYLGVVMATTDEERHGERLWAELGSLSDQQHARQEAVIERLLNDKEHASRLLSWLDARIASDQKLAAQWRPVMVRVLRLLPDEGQRLQRALQQLAEERPEDREKLLAEQFLHGQSGQLGADTMAASSLNDLDVTAIRDVDLLQQLLATVREDGDPLLRERLYRRLLSLSGDNEESLKVWESWLTLLLERGEEARFRAEARRLLAANKHLDAASKQRLTQQMEASIWRQIANSIAVENHSGLLDLAAQAERTTGQQLPWVGWLQAVLAHRRGDQEARDAALQALRNGQHALVSKGEEEEEKEGKEETEVEVADDAVITFPDGLRIRAEALPRLALSPSPSPSGPRFALPPYQLTWRARTLGPIAAMVSYQQGVVVRDQTGLVAFAHDGGRVLWRQELSLPDMVTPQLLRHGDLLLVNSSNGIEARSLDGDLRWRATLGTYPQFTVGEGLVVAMEAERGDLIALDAANGRRRWLQRAAQAAAEAEQPVFAGGGFRHVQYAPESEPMAPISPGSLAVADGLVLSTVDGLRLYDAQHGGLMWQLGDHGEADLPLSLSTGKNSLRLGTPNRVTSGAQAAVHLQTANPTGLWGQRRWVSQRLNNRFHSGYGGGVGGLANQVHMVDDVSAWYDSHAAGNGYMIGPWTLLEGSDMVLAVRRDLPFVGRHFLPGRVLAGGSTPLLVSRSGITRLFADGSRREYQHTIIGAAVSGGQILVLNADSLQILHEQSLTPIAQSALPDYFGDLLRDAVDPERRAEAQREIVMLRAQLQSIEAQIQQYAQHYGRGAVPQLEQQRQHLQFQIARLTRMASPLHCDVSPHPGRWYVQVGTALLAIDGVAP